MRSFRILPIALLLLLAISGCTVGRFVKWNFADRRDYKKFPHAPASRFSPALPLPGRGAGARSPECYRER